MSNSTTTTNASGSTTALSAPLQPDPSLTPPKRPNRFLGFFPAAKPLSPITSSPEMSPNTESSPAFPVRQKQLHLPHILSKLVPSGSLTSLVKVRISFLKKKFFLIFLLFIKKKKTFSTLFGYTTFFLQSSIFKIRLHSENYFKNYFLLHFKSIAIQSFVFWGQNNKYKRGIFYST